MASCPGKATPDGTCNRDYIYIVDLAQAHILALQPGKQGFYNLGSGDGYSVRQVIKMCEEVTGCKTPAVEKPRRPGDPPKLVASAAKAIRELGWSPKHPQLKDIIQTAWAWQKSILKDIPIKHLLNGNNGQASLNEEQASARSQSRVLRIEVSTGQCSYK